jgi:uncharacterized membrane protein YfcA
MAYAATDLAYGDRARLLMLALTASAAVAIYSAGAHVVVGSQVAIGVATFIAAGTSAIVGFAFSGICGAILLQMGIPPIDAVLVMILCSIANQALSVWTMREHISLAQMAPYLVPAMIGVPVGVAILLHVDASLFRRMLGIILIIVCAWTLARPVIVIARPSRIICAMFGFVSGVTGGLAAFPGAPTAIRTAMLGWSKEAQRAVYQPMILILQIEAVVLLAAQHHSGGASFVMGVDALAYIPGSLLGTWLGLSFFRKLTDRQFVVAVNLLLIVSGVTMAA